jgi:hypothetical protein
MALDTDRLEEALSLAGQEGEFVMSCPTKSKSSGRKHILRSDCDVECQYLQRFIRFLRLTR